MAQNAEGNTLSEMEAKIAAAEAAVKAEAATDGLLGPISGFYYDNKSYTGTYIYPEFLDANGVIIWKGGEKGEGVAVGTDVKLLRGQTFRLTMPSPCRRNKTLIRRR